MSAPTPTRQWRWRLPWPGFLADMPVIARPVFVALAGCAVWFLLVSPFVVQGFGEQYETPPVDRGMAEVGECRRSLLSLRPVYSCDARVTWTRYAPDTSTVLSRRDISHTTVVVERRVVKSDRSTVEQWRDRGSRVVTANFPVAGLGGVLAVTLVNLVAIVLIWVVAFWFSRRGVFGETPPKSEAGGTSSGTKRRRRRSRRRRS